MAEPAQAQNQPNTAAAPAAPPLAVVAPQVPPAQAQPTPAPALTQIPANPVPAPNSAPVPVPVPVPTSAPVPVPVPGTTPPAPSQMQGGQAAASVPVPVPTSAPVPVPVPSAAAANIPPVNRANKLAQQRQGAASASHPGFASVPTVAAPAPMAAPVSAPMPAPMPAPTPMAAAPAPVVNASSSATFVPPPPPPAQAPVPVPVPIAAPVPATPAEANESEISPDERPPWMQPNTDMGVAPTEVKTFEMLAKDHALEQGQDPEVAVTNVKKSKPAKERNASGRWYSPVTALVVATAALAWRLVDAYGSDLLLEKTKSGAQLDYFDTVVNLLPITGNIIGLALGIVLCAFAVVLLAIGWFKGIRAKLLQIAVFSVTLLAVLGPFIAAR